MLLVFSNKGKGMQSSSEQEGGALRDDPNNGFEGDYSHRVTREATTATATKMSH